MVLLVAKFNKLYSKLENLHHHHHHHHHHESSEAVLERFFSDIVSNGLTKLFPTPEATSFSWLRRCFELIPMANQAFAELVAAIDHPASRWRSDTAEQYLAYSLSLLELLNALSSSLARLGQARLALSHGLSHKKPRHLKAIEPLGSANVTRNQKGVREEAKTCCSSKEEVVRRALTAMESLAFWVCGVVLSSLSGADSGPGFALDLGFARFDSGASRAMISAPKEVRDVNDSVARVVAAIGDGHAAEELRKRLEAFEMALEGFGAEIDRLFKQVLSGRNQLLSGIQDH